MMELGVASKLVVEGEGLSYEFQKAALTAMGAKENSFTADGTTYTLEYDGGSAIASAGSDVVALLSEYAVQGVENGTVISAELRSAIVEAIEEGQNSFTLPMKTVLRLNMSSNVKTTVIPSVPLPSPN